MINKTLFVGVALSALAGSASAAEPEVRAFLEECRDRQAGRWDGVTHYVVDQSVMGNRVASAYERFEAPGPDGKMYPGFRPMRTNSQFSSEELRLFGQAAERTGKGLSDEMSKAGFPPGMLGGPGQDPWASTDPQVMMGGASLFVNAAADAQDANALERQAAVAEASQSMVQMEEIASRFRLVGTESVEGRQARHLQARGLNRKLSDSSDAHMVIDDADLWIDSEECVPLKLTMAGTMNSDGQTRPVVLERISTDYRKVAGSKMFEPYRQVMRMKGVMTAEQERELGQAQAQLADMEKQLAGMPPEQRNMIMQRMGPQLAAMKSLASGNGFEFVIETHVILVNPDSAALQSLQAASLGAAGMPAMTLPAAGPATGSAAQAASVPAPEAAGGKTAQQRCLEEKIRKKQDAAQKKRGVGRLLGAVGRVAGQFGGADLARAANDVAVASATADDLAGAARDLGITEDEIAACESAK
jgi:hypothetical protein